MRTVLRLPPHALILILYLVMNRRDLTHLLHLCLRQAGFAAKGLFNVSGDELNDYP